ncbi:asparagine synthase (glutamine-hydrolyzing) [candidate division WOR-3 bacterium]|nr:asparagine synthase (glutamine-hydrolyzing) [candidate division WOR-3 bacterium]
MSGICGGFWFDGKPNKGLVSQMAKSLNHRGPDDVGFYFDEQVSLGIDYTYEQKNLYPLHNETKTLWLILDGNIYNFKELKDSLINLGHKFYAQMDGEVILHLYEEKGISCIQELNGDFAFALWDCGNKRLLLARDRFGVKPLYYWKKHNKVLFASEIKALLEDKTLIRTPNDSIIYDFLVTGVHEHTENTFFKGVKKLMPAEYMIVEKDKFKKEKYWKLEVRNKKWEVRSEREIINEFFNIFENSIELRLPETTKFGALLSGGLDSSAVVSMLDRFAHPITFSSCRKDSYLDERKYIEAIVEKYNLRKNYIFPESKKLWEEIEKFIWHQDEPIRGTSIWDHFSVMRFVYENGINILFDGQGGDETLCGYTAYFPQFLWEISKKFQIFRLIKEFALGFDLIFFAIRERLLGRQNSKEFLAKDFLKEFKGREKFILEELFPRTITEKSAYAITKYSLVFLLKETERNAAAYGIETRLPFLDHRLVEYVFSLPLKYKLRNGWTKWILRETMKGILPEFVRKRRRKIGFGTPETRWTRELRQEIETLFNSKEFKSRPYWNSQKISQSFRHFCQGQKLQPDFFWRVISLEIWFRTFL